MAKCTAPVQGHRSAAAAEDCPACRGRYGKPRFVSYPSYTPVTYTRPDVSRSGIGGSGAIGRTPKPRWSRANSVSVYTDVQIRALTPIRNSVEASVTQDQRHVFLCHAWDDRQGVAKDLHDLLDKNGVTVWFSEKDVGLGVPLLRAIDKGLANSKIGIVLVTPALLLRLASEGIADRELSALLAGDRLVPVVHGTTYEELRNVSPLLASRSGLSTAEDTLAEVAEKLAELVAP